MSNRTRLVLMLVASVGVMMLTGCQTHEQKEIACLQGTWEGTKDGLKTNLTFSGNHFELRGDVKNHASGIFKINIKSDPKGMDFNIEKHTFRNNVGIRPGIYKIEDNELFIVVSNKLGGGRPWEFEDGDGGTMAVLTKQ